MEREKSVEQELQDFSDLVDRLVRGTVERDLQILYDFTNDELEVLVQMIIEKGGLTECLSIDESYKLHNPNHKKYIDKIIREIKLFGGNTFGNLFRSEGVSSGVSLSYIKKIESSKSDRAFSLYVLFQLADELAIDIADLVKPLTEFQDLIFESKNGCKLNPISNKNQGE